MRRTRQQRHCRRHMQRLLAAQRHALLQLKPCCMIMAPVTVAEQYAGSFSTPTAADTCSARSLPSAMRCCSESPAVRTRRLRAWQSNTQDWSARAHRGRPFASALPAATARFLRRCELHLWWSACNPCHLVGPVEARWHCKLVQHTTAAQRHSLLHHRRCCKTLLHPPTSGQTLQGIGRHLECCSHRGQGRASYLGTARRTWRLVDGPGQ